MIYTVWFPTLSFLDPMLHFRFGCQLQPRAIDGGEA